MIIPFKFDSIEEINNFVVKAQQCEGKVEIHSTTTNNSVNGKSILGLYSLDLSNPIEIEVELGQDALILAGYYKKAED